MQVPEQTASRTPTVQPEASPIQTRQPGGSLYALGYADPHTRARLEALMHQHHPYILLLDIRYQPRSRWYPAYNRAALASRFGEHYRWMQALGNVNYAHREQGIQLAEGHEQAIHDAVTWLAEGTSLILLCACKHEQTCHRTLVAQRIQTALSHLLSFSSSPSSSHTITGEA